MKQTFSINSEQQLCIGDTTIQYNLGRGAKVDLCLEKIHRFLRRRQKLNVRLENFLNGEDKRAKEQLLKKYDLLCFKERSSLKDAIDVFYEGINTFLQSFSDLLVEKSNYPEKSFRLTEGFYSELMKIDSSSEVFNVILFDDAELETSQRLVSHASLRELAWEIYRDGENLKFSIDEIKRETGKLLMQSYSICLPVSSWSITFNIKVSG